MNQAELFQLAKDFFLSTESPREQIDFVRQKPEAAEPKTTDALLKMASDVRESGHNEIAELLQQTVKQLRNVAILLAYETGKGAPVISGSTVKWAELTRKYFARRAPGDLEDAIKEALSAGEEEAASLMEIVRHLYAGQKVEETGLTAFSGRLQALITAFQLSGRHEELLTMSLLNFDTQATLTELRMPFDQNRLRVIEQGIEASRSAAMIAVLLNDEECEAFYLSVQGKGYKETGRLEQAENMLQQAVGKYKNLARKQPAVYQVVLADVHIIQGNTQRQLGQWDDALSSLQEAAEILENSTLSETEDLRAQISMVFNSIGVTLINETIAISTQKPGIDEGETLEEWTRRESARKYLERSVTIRRELAQNNWEKYAHFLARTLYNFAMVTNVDEALKALTEAVEIYQNFPLDEREKYSDDLTNSLNNLAGLQFVLGKHEEAVDSYRQILAIGEQQDLSRQKISALSTLAKIKRDHGKWADAEEYLRLAVDQIEKNRLDLLSPEHRRRAMLEYHNIYEDLIICLMKLGKVPEAIEISEKSKSRTIIDLISLRDLRPKNVPPEIAEEYEKTIRRAQELESYLRSLSTSRIDSDGHDNNLWKRTAPGENGLQEQIQAVKQARAEINARIEKLVKEIWKHDPDYLPTANPLTAAEIFDLAKRSKSTLVLFRVTRTTTYVFLIFQNGDYDVIEIESFTTDKLNSLLVKYDPDRQTPIDGWVVNYNAYLEAEAAKQRFLSEETIREVVARTQVWYETIDKTLETLHHELMGRIRQTLHEKLGGPDGGPYSLTLIPNKGLSILPLHAAWRTDSDGVRQYFLDDFVVTYAPSLYIYGRCLERERQKRENKKLCLVADPSGDLENAVLECEQIVSELWDFVDPLMLKNAQATKPAVLDAMKTHNWLHFACHGSYNLNAPFESSLELAWAEGLYRSESSLTLAEIMDLELNHTWLAVLSACETGLSDFREITDEFYGLPLGFIIAGTPSVWGTLWSVNDISIRELIVAAYQNLKDQIVAEETFNKPAALRQAQIDLRKIWPHPYHWAAIQSFGA